MLREAINSLPGTMPALSITASLTYSSSEGVKAMLPRVLFTSKSVPLVKIRSSSRATTIN